MFVTAVVSIEEFQKHVEQLREDNNTGFIDEFDVSWFPLKRCLIQSNCPYDFLTGSGRRWYRAEFEIRAKDRQFKKESIPEHPSL